MSRAPYWMFLVALLVVRTQIVLYEPGLSMLFMLIALPTTLWAGWLRARDAGLPGWFGLGVLIPFGALLLGFPQSARAA